jgi:hypothetical protein
LYDSINKVSCPDVFLDLRIAGTPASPIPGKVWRTRIQTWVDSLDYEALLRMSPRPNDEDLPTLELTHEGVEITIKPIPKKRTARGKEGPSIGIQSFEGCFVTSHEEIRETIKDKASRYGALDRPYVIVVNCLGEMVDAEEIRRAMFGHDGLWNNSRQPTHTRVSAVLAMQHLFPWTVSAMCELLETDNAVYAQLNDNVKNAIVESALLHTRILVDLVLSRGQDADDIRLNDLLPTFESEALALLKQTYGSRSAPNCPCWTLNKMLAHPTLLRSRSHDYSNMLNDLIRLLTAVTDAIDRHRST